MARVFLSPNYNNPNGLDPGMARDESQRALDTMLLMLLIRSKKSRATRVGRLPSTGPRKIAPTDPHKDGHSAAAIHVPLTSVHANSFVCRVYTPSATNYSLV